MVWDTQHKDLQVRLRRKIKFENLLKQSTALAFPWWCGGMVRTSGSVPEPRVSVGTVIGPRQLAWPLIGCGLGDWTVPPAYK